MMRVISPVKIKTGETGFKEPVQLKESGDRDQGIAIRRLEGVLILLFVFVALYA
jgi:hypothetical protein